MWRELRDWRQHWSTPRFFQALVFGLLFTLLDTGSDFSFAWTVPDECPSWNASKFRREDLSTPCGLISPKNVEFLTFTFIALPGILLGFSALQSLLRGLAARCCSGRQISENLKAVANLIALLIQGSLSAGLFFAAAYSTDWTEEVPSGVSQVYVFSIKAMAFVSAIFVTSVKLLGVFCHGPETTHLVLRAADAETRFEAASQLALVATSFLNSGTWTRSSLLSAMTSILVIGKVGIESFFKELKGERKLTKASLLDNVLVAASVLPLFLLTAIFKIGSIAILFAWNDKSAIFWHLLALVPPAGVILLIKTCLLLKELSVAAIIRGVLGEVVSLHLWPCGRIGKRIGLGLTLFKLLLFTFLLAWIVNHPYGPFASLVMSEAEAWGPVWEEWARETSSRLRVASISCLVIGWVSLPLIVGQVFYQEIFITKLADKCLSAQEEEEEGIEEKVSQAEVEAMKQRNEIEGENEGKVQTEMGENYEVVKWENGKSEMLKEGEETEENETNRGKVMSVCCDSSK